MKGSKGEQYEIYRKVWEMRMSKEHLSEEGRRECKRLEKLMSKKDKRENKVFKRSKGQRYGKTGYGNRKRVGDVGQLRVKPDNLRYGTGEERPIIEAYSSHKGRFTKNLHQEVDVNL